MTIATWHSYESSYDALVASFGQIDKGSRVLIGSSGEAPDPPLTRLTDYPMYNAPTLAVHFADALVPTFFTSLGKHLAYSMNSTLKLPGWVESAIWLGFH